MLYILYKMRQRFANSVFFLIFCSHCKWNHIILALFWIYIKQIGDVPSSRAWRGHSFDSLAHSTLTLVPVFGLASGGPSSAQLLSSTLALCYLPRDISLCLPEVTRTKPPFSAPHWYLSTGYLLALVAAYSLPSKVSSSPISLLHLDPPHVYTTARRNARPHSLTVFVLSSVTVCAIHNTHSSVVSTGKNLMLFISSKRALTNPFYWESPVMSHTSTGDSPVNGVYNLW